MDPMSDKPSSGFPRAVVVVAIALPVALGVGAAGIAMSSPPVEEATDEYDGQGQRRTGPLPLSSVPAPDAESAECAALLAELPEETVSAGQTLTVRELMDPAPAGAMAWGNADHDPVVVRCGLGAPADLVPTSELVEVSGVQWLEMPGDGMTTWAAVDRPVGVALTVPDDTGSGPIQDVSEAISAVLEAVDVEVG